MNPQQAC